jgi:hypothetical protein
VGSGLPQLLASVPGILQLSAGTWRSGEPACLEHCGPGIVIGFSPAVSKLATLISIITEKCFLNSQMLNRTHAPNNPDQSQNEEISVTSKTAVKNSPYPYP